MLQNTRSVQEMESLPMRNASSICNFVRFFCFQQQQKHDIKKHKKTFLKNKKA